ncbi:hypothetical protein TWF281_005278 [Arthrobotrys megalospora]
MSLSYSNTTTTTSTTSFYGTMPLLRESSYSSSNARPSSPAYQYVRVKCYSCRFYGLIWGAILTASAVCLGLGLYFLPDWIALLKPKNPPICVPPPYERVGLSGLDSPWPGSMYIITEADSTSALTYDGRGGVRMTEYQKNDITQMWTCHETDGWLAFAHDPGAGSTVYLGYRAWPQAATLCSSAKSAEFNEQFDVRSRPDGGFQLRMRNGFGLEPLGRDGGTLSRVRQSDVWWRFTKVQRP